MNSYQRLKQKYLELRQRNLFLENAIDCFKNNLFVYQKLIPDIRLENNIFGISQQVYIDFNKKLNNEILKKMKEFLLYSFNEEEIYKLYLMKKDNK